MSDDTLDTVKASAIARREAMLTMMREADTDSVKEVAKMAYATIASVRAKLAPTEEDYALCLQVLQERLIAEGRTVINDPDFDIALVPGPSRPAERNDGAILRDLLAVRIDGDPIPREQLEAAAWIEPPPPPPEPVVKTHLTKLRALVKKYGKPVQDIIDAHVSPPVPTTRFAFAPKEKHVTRTDQRALRDGGNSSSS